MSFTTLTLTIDSISVAASKIHGSILVSRRENEAATMSVTLIPTTGLQDFDDYLGQSIVLTVDSTVVFTGIVDMPEVNVLDKKVTLICTDKRKEILNEETISSVGYYSTSIFDETDNTYEELENRLKTTPTAADIKPDGTAAFTSMLPKGTADKTLTDSDIYRRSLEVSPTSRARLTNQIILEFKYRYTRKRHREWDFQLGDNSFCDIIDSQFAGAVFLSKTDALAYIDRFGWPVDETSIAFEELPDPMPSMPCTITTIWTGAPNFCEYATFTAAYRYGQTITEKFTLTVKAPQSITQYGTIEWNQSNGHEIEFNEEEWAVNEEYLAPTGLTTDANDYYADEDGVSTDFDDAVQCAINIAATKIIKSHRDTQVSFETDMDLTLDLTKTLALSTDTIDAQGKITALDHIFDISNRFSWTAIEISLSTAQGTQTGDSLTTSPTRPSVPVVADSFDDPTIIEVSEEGEGTMDTPAIDDTSRDEQTVTATQTYNLEIDNNTFGVTF